MGGDGGSIMGRQDLAKLKKRKKTARDATYGQSVVSEWTHCRLTNKKLEDPICIDFLGNLFNKADLIRALLDKTLPKQFSHIKKLKRDTVTLENVKFIDYSKQYDNRNTNNNSNKNWNWNTNTNKNKNATGQKFMTSKKLISFDSIALENGVFECPISGLIGNGKYPFVVLRDCGHLLSVRALKQVSTNKCLVCGKELNANMNDYNQIPVNPSQQRKEEMMQLFYHIETEKKKNKSKNKEKKKHKNKNKNKNKDKNKDKHKDKDKEKEKVKEKDKIKSRNENKSKVENGNESNKMNDSNDSESESKQDSDILFGDKKDGLKNKKERKVLRGLRIEEKRKNKEKYKQFEKEKRAKIEKEMKIREKLQREKANSILGKRNQIESQIDQTIENQKKRSKVWNSIYNTKQRQYNFAGGGKGF